MHAPQEEKFGRVASALLGTARQGMSRVFTHGSRRVAAAEVGAPKEDRLGGTFSRADAGVTDRTALRDMAIPQRRPGSWERRPWRQEQTTGGRPQQ